MEQLLIPYSAVTTLGPGPVLIIAPHPDDEVLGCGGAVRRHVLAGDAIRVVIVTDGTAAPSSEERLRAAQLRREESRAAAAILGYGEPVFWQLPDRGLVYGEPLIQRLLEEIREFAPALVYAPSLLERHPDHRVLAMTVLEALRRLEPAPALAMYEVAVPLNPNRLLDISELVEEKQQAIACFTTQLALQDYGRQVIALNEFRSFTLPKGVRAAEAYLFVEPDRIGESLTKLYLPEHRRQQMLGLELDSADLPLVSIIVRSNGRRELVETLDSVALQTYPRIEVCVICVDGEEIPGLGELCGRYPLRRIDRGEPLPRSRAANTGLEEAHGYYLMFLDDDGQLDPEHVSELARFMEERGHRIAYSGVRCVYQDGADGQAVFNREFDPAGLLAGNYIPIHAVLFRRDFVDQGCRFDEGLDLYEDWDFWLQLSMLARFHHLDQITASCRSSPDSGCGVNALERQAEESALKVYRKWCVRWSDKQLSILMTYARQRAETWRLPETVAHLQGLVATRDAELETASEKQAALNNRIALCDNELGELREQLEEWKRNARPQQMRTQELARALDETVARLDQLEAILTRIHSKIAFRVYRQSVKPIKSLVRGLRHASRLLFDHRKIEGPRK